MLNWLQIKNFAISEHIELEIAPGLSVITGETGAGKSIMVRALSLVLGQRADAKQIKHGQDRAEIQVDFDIRQQIPLQKLLKTLELDEQNECQLRRVINRDSGSHAYINGRRVTASILRQVGEHLVDIHGQNEHHSLLYPEAQRDLLDKYAGISDQVQTLSACYRELKKQYLKQQTLRADAASAHEKLAFLQFQVDELDRFAPTAQEWTELHQQHQRIHHQAELVSCVQIAEKALFGDENNADSTQRQLNTALGALEKAQLIDAELKPIADVLLEAQTLLNESEASLRAISETFSFDPSELETIEQRYAAFMEFARKHRVEPAQLYDTYSALKTQLEAAQNPAQNEQALSELIDKLKQKYIQLAAKITAQRKKSAVKLAKRVSQNMQTLAMEGGEFFISLIPAQGSLKWADSSQNIGTESGAESIVFEASTNAGIPKMPLSKVASGGELSRISLAIALILSDLGKVDTLVFDEVDVGVGGKTAAVIGRMLAELAKSKQIICITHLPQVAAFGHHHFHVHKHQGEQVHPSVESLNTDDKVREIARMVGGEKLTDESLAHARTLILESV